MAARLLQPLVIWPTLKQASFGDREIAESDGKVVLDAPVTAEDPAMVPITVRVPPGAAVATSGRVDRHDACAVTSCVLPSLNAACGVN